jgi:hypothetical protein
VDCSNRRRRRAAAAGGGGGGGSESGICFSLTPKKKVVILSFISNFWGVK